MLKFHRNQSRGTDPKNNVPKVDRIVIHLRTCPFDSYLCSIVNLEMFYPMKVWLNLFSSPKHTDTDKYQYVVTYSDETIIKLNQNLIKKIAKE